LNFFNIKKPQVNYIFKLFFQIIKNQKLKLTVMKKIILFTSLCFFVFSVYAQTIEWPVFKGTTAICVSELT